MAEKCKRRNECGVCAYDLVRGAQGVIFFVDL